MSGRLSHAYGISSNKEFEITAVCDLSEENRNRAQSEHNCAVYADYNEMLATEKLDLASVVTRSDTHCSIVCDCLEAGLHCVVTKPWALNEKEALTMMEAEEATGCRLFPWIPMYWSPDYTAIQQLLREKAIGEVFLIRRSYSDFRYRTDWQTERQYGGGYLLNWGMHLVQPVVGLANAPVKRVFGQLQQAINPGDADDNFIAMLEFANGIRGVAEFTQSAHPFPGFIIQGTQGTIMTDMENITVTRGDPRHPEALETSVEPLNGKVFGDEADIYRDIASSLLKGTSFRTSPALALQGTRLIEAVQRSHDQRKVVELSQA